MLVQLRDGLRLHVLARGVEDGSLPLLMLHGFTGRAEAWGEELLRRLGAGRRVLAVDLPGHGLSSAPARPARYSLDAILEDLLELLGALEIDRAVWVGYSMGGRIALGGAVCHPHRVGGLILESTSPGLAGEAEREARRLADEKLATRIERRGIEPFVDYWTQLSLFATQEKLPVSMRETIRARRLLNRPDALAACLRGLGTGSQPSFWNELGRIQAPALILAGSEDERYRRIGARMSEEIPDAAFVAIRGAGHTTHLEEPGQWGEAAERFLDSLN